jgi:hypothetical protein
MNRKLAIRISCFAGAVFFALAGIYCLLWALSSSSLACTACNCSYSLWAENARCRQPPVALLLSLFTFSVAAVMAVFGRKSR